MCSHGYLYKGNEKQTPATLKGHYVYTILQCHISLKEPFRPYTSRIFYGVPKIVFFLGEGGALIGSWALIQAFTVLLFHLLCHFL